MERGAAFRVGSLDEGERRVADIAEERGVQTGSVCVEEGVGELEVEREVPFGVVGSFRRGKRFDIVFVC